jgi:dTDP-glucose 4,6-dehydratase
VGEKIMNILITGGAGFIGSAVVRLAISRGYNVINVDCLTYSGSLKNVSSISNHKNYKFIDLNIKDQKSLKEVFAKYQPDKVIHLAAETHVDRSIANPIEFINTNVLGTFNLLEAAKNYWELLRSPDSFRFLHVSTDEVFGSLNLNSNAKFSESSCYDPRSPYSSSKASSDHLVRSWFHTYDLPVIITNCSNNYGPYQFPEKLIPVIIINALSEKSFPIYGDGKNIRDWLYVDDHANALLMCLEKGAIGRSYNIGSNNELANIDLIKLLCNILDSIKPLNEGKYEKLIKFVSDRLGHDKRYAIDSTRIFNELGWKPLINIEDGLRKTVNWYINNENWWKSLIH